MTSAERKAMLFLAALLLLGGVTRLAYTRRFDQLALGDAGSGAALGAQIAAVDSQRQQRATARRVARRTSSSRRGTAARQARQAESVIVDVDRATAGELEALPRIGPVLARRIVQDRDEYGPFGSLNALQRVKGIGPKLVMHIAPHVTFSGTMRPFSALSVSMGSEPHRERPPPPG